MAPDWYNATQHRAESLDESVSTMVTTRGSLEIVGLISYQMVTKVVVI